MVPESESRSTRHHMIIAAAGCAGTSLLVKILSACGLDTELNRGNSSLWSEPNAGIETLPLAGRELPYVLKSPWTYQFLEELLCQKDVRIDGLIVPIRDLREAAASRSIIELQNMHRSAPDVDELLARRHDWGHSPGGVTYPLEPIDQARILGQNLHLLLEKALEHEIPICMIKFPKFARDPTYLYENLSEFISDKVDRAQFETIFRSIVSPELSTASSELDGSDDTSAVISMSADQATQLPALVELENIALKRELGTKRLKIAQASTEIETLKTRCTELEAELAAAVPKATLMQCERDNTLGPASVVSISLPDLVRDEDSGARLRTFASDVGAVISPSSFWVPEYFSPSAWIEHAPFAFWICDALRPRRFVELGTHYGYSYFAFCQAIDRLGLGTTAYAVDTWQGDEHAGFYSEDVFRSVDARNRQKYSAFSRLMRTTFEDALRYFGDGSVDLLHIDGRHFYDDVRHDFTMWRPKLAKNAVVLFHDTNVREREFGVWKFFEEIAARHPSFQFFHGHGLGVLTLGDSAPEPLANLLRASSETAGHIRAVYACLGGALTARRRLGAKSDAISVLLNKELGGASTDAETVAQISDWDDQAQQLLRDLKARDSALEEVRAQLEQQAASEAAVRAEVEQRATTEAGLRADLEQRAATEAALRADLEQRAANEAALRAEVEQRAATETALRNALDQANREAESWKLAFDAGKAEMATIRDVLEKTDRALQERTASAENYLAELELTRSALAEGEHRRQEEEAAATALQAQIIALRGALAVAREVGRAALASLQNEPAMLPAPSRTTDLLGFVRRSFGVRTTTLLPMIG